MDIRKGSDGKYYTLNEQGTSWVVTDAPKPKYDPKAEKAKLLKQQAKDTSTLEALVISMGRTGDKLATGYMDLIDKGIEKAMPDWWGEESRAQQAKTKADQAQKDEYYNPLSKEHRVATFTGEALPYLAIPGGAGSGILNAMGRGATQGAAEGAMHYDDDMMSGAAWGAGGNVTGQWLGDLLGGGIDKLKGAEPKIIKYAKDNNLFVPPGMASGSKPFQQMDQALKTHRLTSDKILNEKLVDSMVIQNNLISKEIGAETDYFTDDYFENQMKRIKSGMDDATKGATANVNMEQALSAEDIAMNYGESSVTGTIPAILNRSAEKLGDLIDGNLDSKTHGIQTRALRKQATNQFNSPSGDNLLGESLNEMADLYDDILSTGSSFDKDAYRQLRKEYALLNSVEQTKDVSGNAMPIPLAKKFKSSSEIKKLAEVEKLRNKQSGASLSTSGLLGKMLNPLNPTESIGAMSLLSGRTVGGVLPLFSDMSTDLYLKGYPHITGIIPGSKKPIEKMMKASALSIGDSEDE